MCEKTDNSCREEKLTCKGCKYNKRKIIEIYLTENDEDFYIDVEKIEDTETANSIIKRLLYCLAEGII